MALGVIKQVIDDCRDMITDRGGEKKNRLPTILISLILDKNKQNTEDILQVGIPDIVADILLEWQRRGLESLYFLPPSTARDELEFILENTLNLTQSQM